MNDDDDQRRAPTRRQILGFGLGAGAAAALLGCRSGGRVAEARKVADAGTAPKAKPAPAPPPTPTCEETEDNLEGPYYRDGAPRRADLREPGMTGNLLILRGTVLGVAAASCAALEGAELDIWQANAEGHYDNDGSHDARRGEYHLRGKLRTAADGSYELKTIWPGRYLNGKQFRPAHIHVKLAAPGYQPLTTQLYFPGDPYNDIDPFIKASLVMAVEPGEGVDLGRFDFVLPAATRR